MKRIDAYEKVTGKAKYADDLQLDRMIYAVPLHSSHPSAKIKSIDIDKAKEHLGVMDIITAKDVLGSNLVGVIVSDQPVFAEDRVRYMGDVVACVAADTREHAHHAASLIKVDYEPCKALFSPIDALAKDAPSVHEGRSNVVLTYKVRHGNSSSALKNSDQVLEEEFRTSFVEHAYLEPESCVAVPEPDGSITVHGGMQHPFTTRRFVAAATNLTLARVRIKQTTLGGGFGGKDDTVSVICARAAILALRTKRPVKMTYTREESIRESYKRHPFEITYKAGIGKDGKFKAMDIDFTADSGPICSTSPFVIWRPTVQCTGPYIVPNVRCDSKAVYTNNTFTGAMRGFGTPQQVFACESFIDMCAEKVGMDPYEFRKRNFFKQGITTHTGQRLKDHKVSIQEVTDKALKEFGWNKKYKSRTLGKPRKDGLLYGTGFACSYRGVSLGAEGNDFSSAIVNILADGSILLQVGVSENGQGLKTAMVKILCDEMGIDALRVRFIDTDTSSVPDGGPTVASRGTIVGGNAVLDACRRIKDQMKPVLRELIGAPGRAREGVNYIYKNGRVRNPKNRKSVSFNKAVAACHDRRMYLYSLGVFKGPPVHWKEETGQGDAYFTYVYGCQACELTVDPKTGKVNVLKVVAAHEVGKAINPQMAAGQIFGGIAMGLGFALSEKINHKDGVIENLNYNTYKISRSVDMPEMTAILVENPDPIGPFGAKSLGEPTNELMGAACANAIYNATGVRFKATPITAEIICAALP